MFCEAKHERWAKPSVILVVDDSRVIASIQYVRDRRAAVAADEGYRTGAKNANGKP